MTGLNTNLFTDCVKLTGEKLENSYFYTSNINTYCKTINTSPSWCLVASKTCQFSFKLL